MRHALLALIAPFVLAALPASALPVRPFTPAALAEAQAANQPILVDVHADWCPTCRSQDPTISSLAQDPAFANLVILKLDFDSQKAERKALGVEKQSTLIAYRGKAERSRSTGITDPGQIRTIAAAALR